MNPEKISIPDITLQDPVKRSAGKITYCLLPCSHNDQRLQLKLQTKFKLFAHEGNSFSLGINLPEENIQHYFKDKWNTSKQSGMRNYRVFAKISEIGDTF